MIYVGINSLEAFLLLEIQNKMLLLRRNLYEDPVSFLFPKRHIRIPPVRNIQIEYAPVGMPISILFNIEVAITKAKVPFCMPLSIVMEIVFFRFNLNDLAMR